MFSGYCPSKRLGENTFLFEKINLSLDVTWLYGIAYTRGDSMIFKNIEKVVGLRQPAGRDYALSIE